MRNASEEVADPQRPDLPMSTDSMESVLKSMTVQTTFRAWFHPLDSFTEYDDADGMGPYLSRGAMRIRGPEADASMSATHIDYEMEETDYECNARVTRGSERIELEMIEPDAFYAIKVMAQGIPGREMLTLGSNYTELIADPKDDVVTIDGEELDQNDVEQMVIVLQNWLRNKS